MLERKPWVRRNLLPVWWKVKHWWELFWFPCSACGKPLGFLKHQSGAYDPDIIHVKCLERYIQQEGL